jgi:WD40 repeat protein
MTRWFAFGLLLICGVSAQAQTADMIEEIVGFVRPMRPNPFGGGLVRVPQFQIAAQQKAVQPPPVPVQPQPQQQPPATPAVVRRPLRSTTTPAGPPKLDQYGDQLPPGAVARYGSSRLRHGAEPLGLGFSHDGKVLGSMSSREDGIRLWDPKTGKELYRLSSPASLAAFCRDGSIVFVDETRCKVWIPASNHIRALPEKTLPEGVQAIAVHPDCRTFAAGYQQKILQIDLSTGKLIRELKCPNEQVATRLGFSPDGRWLAGSGQKTGVWLWDLRTGKRVRTYHSEFDFPEFAFNSNGTRLAIAAEHLRIYPTDAEEMVENYNAPMLPLQNPRFSADGNWVYGMGPEGHVYQVNASTGEFQEPGDTPEENLRSPMAVSREGALAAATDPSGAIRIWDPKTGKEIEIDRLPMLSEPAFSKDGKTVWCMSGDGRVHEFEAATGKRTKIIELPVPENSPMWMSADHRIAIACVGGEEPELQVIDVDAKRVVNKIAIRLINGTIASVDFCTTDRNRVAVFGMGAVAVIDVKSGKAIRYLNVGNSDECPQPEQGAISPDGRLVAVTTRPLSIWEVSTGKKRYDLQAVMNAAGAVFSPDGRYLAGWDTVGNIVLFDVRLGTVVLRIQNPVTNEVALPVAFSSDGKRLAAGDGDGGITVWDLTTGAILQTLDRHDGYVCGLAFSPDGGKLASASQDGTVLVWEVAEKESGKAQEAAISRLEEAFRLLASSDAAQAQRGLEFLYRRPAETVKLCSDRISIPVAVLPEKIVKLIEDLGSEDFADRQAAVKDLEAVGGEAIDALRNIAFKSSNPETRKLADEIIKHYEAAAHKGDDLRLIRLVELLENTGTPEARSLLAKWAGGPKGHRMTKEAAVALERIKTLGK